MNKAFPKKRLFYGSTRYFYLKQAGIMISGIQFYENGMPNIIQN